MLLRLIFALHFTFLQVPQFIHSHYIYLAQIPAREKGLEMLEHNMLWGKACEKNIYPLIGQLFYYLQELELMLFLFDINLYLNLVNLSMLCSIIPYADINLLPFRLCPVYPAIPSVYNHKTFPFNLNFSPLSLLLPH